ncbi:MAG: dienelactone hydrolase family protein [OCS116 cluster bacterium]|nr:dienelactone hydrolase family protein [OCS116 cluster bacterium]
MSKNIITIDGPRLEPKEQINKLVIFLHGYGSNGNDLISLTESVYKSLPNTAFVSPNAPFACDGSPSGYQWFPLHTLSYEEKLQGTQMAAPHLNAFIDAQKQKYGIEDKDIALFGFSQGTMMALYIAPRRANALGAVIGFSGALTAIDELATETTAKPPILLVHGSQDDVVPHKHLAEAENALNQNGFNVTTHTSQGVAHGIAPDGIDMARDFLVKHLLD